MSEETPVTPVTQANTISTSHELGTLYMYMYTMYCTCTCIHVDTLNLGIYMYMSLYAFMFYNVHVHVHVYKYMYNVHVHVHGWCGFVYTMYTCTCINECCNVILLFVVYTFTNVFVCLLSEVVRVEEVASELVGRVLEKVLREERERWEQHSREGDREGEVSLYILYSKEGGREGGRGRKEREERGEREA